MARTKVQNDLNVVIENCNVKPWILAREPRNLKSRSKISFPSTIHMQHLNVLPKKLFIIQKKRSMDNKYKFSLFLNPRTNNEPELLLANVMVVIVWSYWESRVGNGKSWPCKFLGEIILLLKHNSHSCLLSNL